MRFILVLLLLTLYFFISAQVIHFKDPKFKNALVNTLCVHSNSGQNPNTTADLNKDGEIDLSEALIIKGLVVSNQDISNIDEISFFKNLNFLDCQLNFKINTIRVDSLKELKELYCLGNQITSIDLKNITKLEVLSLSYNKLETLDVGNLPKLRALGCSNNNLSFIDVEDLTELTTFYCNHNQISQLDVKKLVNLKHFRCNNNLLSSLNIDNLKNLSELTCGFNNLSHLDVSDFEKLTLLNCENCKLTQLLLKGTKVELNELSFQNNSKLKYICCSDNQLSFVEGKILLYGLNNCEVNSYCSFTPGGKFYIIEGQNLYDGNNTGCDIQDSRYSNIKYKITNGSDSGSLILNSTGKYSIPVQAGTHTTTPILENLEHFEVTPSSATVTFPSTTDTITQDFCITPKGIFRQTNITVIPLSPPARPGFDASYKIVWENAGNQIESGTLSFNYDERLLDYISATQTADQVADGIIKWNFTNLLPFEKREIIVTLKVNRPTDTPAVNAGDKLYLTASILDNIFTLENTVVGSYDPNDKTCLQGDRVKPDMVGEYVDYLIRFENTGNYAAENVVIKDIIDTKTFDISTLKIIDASHEVYTRIEDNKVEFIFENIQLPFDDANNDGYIAFKIKTLPSLVLGDSLKNLADIYFDYNFPIRTNEAQTTVALPVFTKDIASEVNIYPNPVTDILYFDTNENWTKVEIYDISGRIMRSVSLVVQSIDVSGLESGTYFIRLKDGENGDC